MVKKLIFIGVGFILFFSITSLVQASTSLDYLNKINSLKPTVDSGGLLVLMKDGKQRSLLNVSSQKLSPKLFLTKNDSTDLLNKLKNDPNVLAVQRNNPVQINAISNDRMSYRTWSFENNKNYYFQFGPYVDKKEIKDFEKKKTRPAKVDADIDLASAWKISKGSKNVKVAVVDTGIDYFHPDLQGQLWSNGAEVAGNGIDDDANGYIDDVRGWNFVAGDNDPFDDAMHGTHVAGTIGAKTNNLQGVPGINQNVSLMPVKTFDSSGQGSDATIVAGIQYAVENGAKIINGSFGTSERTPVLEALIKAHPEVLFVFAAGNLPAEVGAPDPSTGNREIYQSWPCQIRLQNTICVGATNAQDKMAGFSSYGTKYVGIAAPGENIVSTVPFYNGCNGAADFGCLKLLSFTPNSLNDFNNNWTSGGINNDWGSKNIAASPMNDAYFSLDDSISGKYLANTDSFAQSPEKSFTASSPSCMYGLVASGRLESGADLLKITVSNDGGETFKKLTALTGKLEINLGPFGTIPITIFQDRFTHLSNQKDYIFRYNLITDGDTEYQGVEIISSAVYCQGQLANLDVMSGTSMAAPHVAGVAGLLFAKKSTATPYQVKQAIYNGSDKVKALNKKINSQRRLNAYKALRALK